MNGLQLSSMEASDMLDVIHYFFEEDIVSPTPEFTAYKSARREDIYTGMYERPFKFAIKVPQSSGTSAPEERKYDAYITEPEDDGGLAELKPLDPVAASKGRKIRNAGYDVPRVPFDPVAAGL